MTILSTIMGVESSGGHNVTQGNIGDINNRTGDLAQGYFQITGGTWAQFGGLQTGYTQANQAPYATQLAIAQNIPVSRWGPDTQAALASAGYSTSRGQTLGQLMSANNETGGETVAADGSTITGSGTTIANGPTDSSSGLASGGGVGPDSDPLGSSVTMNPSGTASTTTSGTGAAQGAQVQVAAQPELVTAVTNWITGLETAMGSTVKGAFSTFFGGTENWLIRGFLIVVGIVILAIGLMKLMDPDNKALQSIAAALPRAA